MLPASNAGAGMNIGFPDVCVTPVGPVPTPIPYPNMALNATMVPFAPNVLVSFVPALNMGSVAPMTLGDQAGVLSPFMGPGMATMGNPTVLVNALPATNLLCPTTGNNMINALGAVMVPSITNVFYSRAAAPPVGPAGAETIAGVAAAFRSAERASAQLVAEGVALVRVPLFSASVPAQVFAALRRLDAAALAIVVDLRGCPGGELLAAIELASDFLPRGAEIATVTDGEGDAVTYRARGGGISARPLYLLVDRGTASAAEVFAGALRAHRRAVVVGESTHGKGVVQALLPGDGEPGARYATVASVTLPSGVPLQGRGLAPDVAAAPTAALEVALAAIRQNTHEVP